MQAMMDFTSWFLSELPDFLLAEPICYFVGFACLFIVADLVKRIINIT